MKNTTKSKRASLRLSGSLNRQFTRLLKRLAIGDRMVSLDYVARLLLESRLERSEWPSGALGKAAIITVFEAVKSIAELRPVAETRTVVETRSIAEAIEIAHLSVIERSVLAAEAATLAELWSIEPRIEVTSELCSVAELCSAVERASVELSVVSSVEASRSVVGGIRQRKDAVFDLGVQKQLLIQRIELGLQSIMRVLFQFASDHLNLNRTEIE